MPWPTLCLRRHLLINNSRSQPRFPSVSPPSSLGQAPGNTAVKEEGKDEQGKVFPGLEESLFDICHMYVHICPRTAISA